MTSPPLVSATYPPLPVEKSVTVVSRSTQPRARTAPLRRCRRRGRRVARWVSRGDPVVVTGVRRQPAQRDRVARAVRARRRGCQRRRRGAVGDRARPGLVRRPGHDGSGARAARRDGRDHGGGEIRDVEGRRRVLGRRRRHTVARRVGRRHAEVVRTPSASRTASRVARPRRAVAVSQRRPTCRRPRLVDDSSVVHVIVRSSGAATATAETTGASVGDVERRRSSRSGTSSVAGSVCRRDAVVVGRRLGEAGEGHRVARPVPPVALEVSEAAVP